MTFKMKASVAALLTFAALGTAQAAGVTVTVACGSVGQDFEFCKKSTAEWAEKTGNTVKIFTAPNSTTDILSLFRQMFAAKSTDLDVMMIDVVWPGILKDHLLDLTPYAKDVIKEHFPAIVANNTVDGKLVAMPWFTDAGLLYYRKDLLEKYKLEVPKTWAELTDAAKKIQEGERAGGDSDFQGFVFQAKAYEGLTCDALEWVASFGGGSIVEKDGKISVNNPKAAAALDTAASWIGTIAPQGVLNYAEEEARGVFQNGKAAFMRNWPYAWSLANGDDSRVKGMVGAAALPAGPEGKPASTLGGWQLAVSKYSKNPKEAADLTMFLTSKETQKMRAIKGSFNPTIPDLYKDKEVLAATPFFGDLYDVFINAVPRPATVTGSKYPEVSSAFWNATADVLAGKSNGTEAVKQLENRLNRIKRKAW